MSTKILESRKAKDTKTRDTSGVTARQSVVTVDIKAGRATPAQRQAWKCFWRKRISECQRELKAESEAKK